MGKVDLGAGVRRVKPGGPRLAPFGQTEAGPQEERDLPSRRRRAVLAGREPILPLKESATGDTTIRKSRCPAGNQTHQRSRETRA